MTKRTFALAMATAAALVAAGLLPIGRPSPRPADRSFTIEAEKYGYTPAVIKVSQGDRVTLRLRAKDVTHGFFLEGYDLDARARPQMPTFWVRRPSTGEDYRTVEEVTFTADREGKFRYRCSVTCGYMHPFMQGELIVGPNRLFSAALLASFAITLFSLAWFARPKEDRCRPLP